MGPGFESQRVHEEASIFASFFYSLTRLPILFRIGIHPLPQYAGEGWGEGLELLTLMYEFYQQNHPHHRWH
jgi:hypothetical protein